MMLSSKGPGQVGERGCTSHDVNICSNLKRLIVCVCVIHIIYIYMLPPKDLPFLLVECIR